MSYNHFTKQERFVTSHLKIAGFSLREIGRRLNRHNSTISRELRRAKSGSSGKRVLSTTC